MYCGSRFCSPAESHYTPIEGEGLATITGLEKCKFFVLGLKNLILCVDHKPLLAILGDKQNLADIPNPRIINCKLQSMLYRFKIHHIAGKDHVIPDAFSRRHDSPIAQATVQKLKQDDSMSNVFPGYSDTLAPPSWVSNPTVSALTPTPEESRDASDVEELLSGVVLASITGINSHSYLAPLTSPSQPTVLSWSRLEAACMSCDEYKLLHKTVQSGVSDHKEDWDQKITDFFIHRHSLVTVGPVVMLHDRPVIPRSLQHNVLEHLHAGHANATAMFDRAATSLYWPNLRADMINYRAACPTCTRYAPSNPAMPPTEPEHPTYPFQSVCVDFFHISPHNYLSVVDRYSNWLSIFLLPKDDSAEIVKVLRDYLAVFGIPCTLTSDGASVFTSKHMEEFCDRWGIIHRVSTAYNARANKRAEVGVKSAKRLVRGNLTQTGALQTDRMARALLAHRNTPCPITGLSPAQIVYGRVLRDFLPLQPGKFQPRPEWRQAAEARDAAYAKRHIRKTEQLTRGSRPLPNLQAGDHVSIQNQTGQNPRQWLQTGVVIETGPYDSYFVSVDGSITITKRNRQFLRKIVPFHATPISQTSTAPVTRSTRLPLPNLRHTPSHESAPIAQPDDKPSSEEPNGPPAVQPEDQPGKHQTNNEQSPSKPKLPAHLRERWIVAKPPQQHHDHANTNVAPIYAMNQYNPMISQYNPMMNQYNPVMNQYNPLMGQYNPVMNQTNPMMNQYMFQYNHMMHKYSL